MTNKKIKLNIFFDSKEEEVTQETYTQNRLHNKKIISFGTTHKNSIETDCREPRL